MKGTLFIAAITILSCLPASSLHAKKKIITLTEHFTTDNKIKWDGPTFMDAPFKNTVNMDSLTRWTMYTQQKGH